MVRGIHSRDCDVYSDDTSDESNVDKKKLRNKLRDVLNKIELEDESSLDKLLGIAKDLGFRDEDIPVIPQAPPDYHDEPGRPYFGPYQVRHASDLKQGERYFLVTHRKAAGGHVRIGFNFSGFEYISEDEKWYMLYVVEEGPYNDLLDAYGINRTALESVGLQPFLITVADAPVDTRWEHTSWLEFAPYKPLCSCGELHDK